MALSALSQEGQQVQSLDGNPEPRGQQPHPWRSLSTAGPVHLSGPDVGGIEESLSMVDAGLEVGCFMLSHFILKPPSEVKMVCCVFKEPELKLPRSESKSPAMLSPRGWPS